MISHDGSQQASSPGGTPHSTQMPFFGSPQFSIGVGESLSFAWVVRASESVMSAARPTAVTHQREPKVCMLVRSFPCRRSRCSGCATFRVAAGYLLHTTSRRSGRPIGETKGFCEGDRTPPSETFVHFRPALERATPTAKGGPKTAQSDLAVVALIRALLATSPFHSEGHRKVRVRLRQHGVHVGKARVLRLMRV